MTIVIPSFNCEQYLREAVDSALAQTYPHIEVVVVDDGSRTEQAAVLADITDPRLRVVRQDNRGAGEARNVGVRSGSGGLIAFLDADDRWLPRKLEIQLQRLREQGADVVFSDQYRFRGVRRLPGTYLDFFRLPANGTFFSGLVRRNFVPLSTAVLRRETFESVGGFCPDRAIVEDWDLWLRLARGHAFAVASEPLNEYRLHDSNDSGDVEVLTRRSLNTLSRLEVGDPAMFRNAESDLRHSRANLMFDLGYARLTQGRTRDARAAFYAAARLRPLEVRIWKGIIKSNKLLQLVRQAW